MLGSLKRRRMLRERGEAVGKLNAAARAFVAAIREAEGALDDLKSANDRLYASDVQAEQLILSDLRRSRERMFAFVAAKEIVAEAPRVARLLSVSVASTQAMPLTDWIQHTSKLDLSAIGEANEGKVT